MNNITKEKIAQAVLGAIETEKLLNKEVAAKFGFSPVYMSMIKNSRYFDQCPQHAWDTMRNWIYSGKKIKEFIKGVVKSDTEAEPVPETQSHIIEPKIKIKPGVLESRKEVLKARKKAKKTKKVAEPTFTGSDDPDYCKHVAMAAEDPLLPDIHPDPISSRELKAIMDNGIMSRVKVKEQEPSNEFIKKIILDIEVRVSFKQ